jgi:cobalamin biosynthesis Mg chelatase CobN
MCIYFKLVDQSWSIVPHSVHIATSARRLVCLQVIQLTGADLYARSPAEWRARAETASDVRAQFAEILEDDVRGTGTGGTGTGGTPRGASKFTSVAADAMSQPKKRKKQSTGLSDASPMKASETKGGAAGVASARKHVAQVDPLSSDSLRKPRKASKQKDSLQIYKSKADDLTTEPPMSMPGKPKKHKIAGAIVGGGLTEQVVEQDRKHSGQDGLTDQSALTTSRCTGASLAPKRKKTKVKGGGGKRVDDVKTLYQLLSA